MLLKSLLLPLALLQATSALSIKSPQEDVSDKHQLQARTDTINVPFGCLGSNSPGTCFTVAAIGVTLYKVGDFLHYHAVHTSNPNARGIVNLLFANGNVPIGYGPGSGGLPGKIYVDSRMGPGVTIQS